MFSASPVGCVEQARSFVQSACGLQEYRGHLKIVRPERPFIAMSTLRAASLIRMLRADSAERLCFGPGLETRLISPWARNVVPTAIACCVLGGMVGAVSRSQASGSIGMHRHGRTAERWPQQIVSRVSHRELGSAVPT